MSIQGTHWDDCWKSGPAHYECALGEIERLQLAYDDQHAVASLMHQQAEKAEAEVERLKIKLFSLGAMNDPPCFACGYNGAGYYQPDVHLCAALHHAARGES